MVNYVKEIIDEWDPVDTLSHAPIDEYQTEIEEIQLLLNNVDNSAELADGIFCIFVKSFGKDIFSKPKEECERIAKVLIFSKTH